jgi:hypothetical protein
MGKRSNFERKERDFYRTPYEAVVPLVPHLEDVLVYIEPCAGDGTLIDHIPLCSWGYDIEPQKSCIRKKDALSWVEGETQYATHFITNPPWSREILHPIIDRLSSLLPTWLLFDADWAYTKQSIPYMEYCRKIVAVGRVRWFPESKMTRKDNCSWYLFDKNTTGQTQFYARIN